jgi:hypothetical protein
MEYFIFYSYLTATENGVGNCSISRKKPIRNLEDIRGIEQDIKKTFVEQGFVNPNIVIANWKEIK